MVVLQHIIDIIDRLQARRRTLSAPYFVPGLWVDGETTNAIQVNPYDFYRDALAGIAAAEPQPLVQGPEGGGWSQYAIVYNLFPRLTTAFDHDADGALHIGPGADGWRETGTLLKCIALLPYIRAMGFNTVHLLPISAIGKDGKKGTLGSPYAIRNPYRLDTNLDEPALDLTVDELFAGFVEAAHHLGLRVVMEFVLRTAARDADWIRDHPDWFYWIRDDVPDRTPFMGRTAMLSAYGQPIFTPETLGLIHAKIGAGDFHDLPPPPSQYRSLFTRPPRPDQVTQHNGRYIGVLDDGTRVRVPGAFTDWPPNDNQPPWSDVTYLRMYDHHDFNYMAYNTLRMYDARLSGPEHRNRPLWHEIIGVIPHYQTTFNIDGVLIDMGHALPLPLKERIIARARQINPDFAFWDEDFSITARSREEGYNAVVGFWMLGLHEGHSVRNMIGQMAHGGFPITFFAAPENHNTPRAFSRYGGMAYAHYALALSIMIPAIPFIASGFELGETQPINTGLGFTNEQLAQYPADRLPLFSAHALNWTRPEHYVKSVRYALEVRRRYAWLLADPDPSTFVIGHADNPHLLVFSRRKDGVCLAVIANTDMVNEHRGRAVVNARTIQARGLWGVPGGGDFGLSREAAASVYLSPGYVLILEDGDLTG